MLNNCSFLKMSGRIYEMRCLLVSLMNNTAKYDQWYFIILSILLIYNIAVILTKIWVSDKYWHRY